MLHQKMAALGVAPKYVARHVCTPLDLEAIVMERMQESATNWSIGKSLTARRRARNRILELVDAAHSAGVFHGDLHADQIMKRGDKWRLLNWGLAHRGNGGRTLPWWLGRKHFGGKRNQRAATVVSHALRLTPKTTVMEPLNVIDL